MYKKLGGKCTFEVYLDNQLIYSKLKTKTLPDVGVLANAIHQTVVTGKEVEVRDFKSLIIYLREKSIFCYVLFSVTKVKKELQNYQDYKDSNCTCLNIFTLRPSASRGK